MDRLLYATGTSSEADAEEAGRAAAAEAVAGLGGQAPALVLVYSSVRYELPALLAAVRSVTGAAPLAGSTSAGHFAGGAAGEAPRVMGPGEGVMVLALAGGDYRFGVGSATGMAENPEAAGTAATRAARAAARATACATAGATAGATADAEAHASAGAAAGAGQGHAAVVLITDSLAGDQQAVLNGVHRVAGASVPVVGGAAGDDGRMTSVGLFHDGAVISGGVVAVWIDSPRPLTVGSAHGWVPISLPLLVTRSEGTVIHELGGRRADEVYAEISAAFESEHQQQHQQQQGGTDAMWRYSYALGTIEPDGSHLVRGVYAARDGEIHTFTPLPPFTAVQVMTADPPTLLGVVDGVVDEVLGEGKPSVLLAFGCTARMAILGADFPLEPARIVAAAGDATVFGMYTYGEFARSNGLGGVHNATLTALAL